MAAPAISIESVGKRYQLGEGHGAETKLSQRIEWAVRAPVRRLFGRPVANRRVDEFWALKDVSLEIEPGGVIGVIGPNGSGKSTLLKLLAQITPPTEGRITLRGRVASLLEVGTGFHPELTGRENLSLNAAILGLGRAEIANLYDEIIEFSGLEPEFIDTPVKRYSSGMQVRLAFSVAAHILPEILLIDEVLAVGDADFQRKCLGRMENVASQGRTVVFVSHDLSSMQRLTKRCVWLDHGRVIEDGPTERVIADYLKRVGPKQVGGEADVAEAALRVGTGQARLIHVALLDAEQRPIEQVELGQPCSVRMTFDVREPIREGVAELGITKSDGARVATSLSIDDGTPPFALDPGIHEIDVALDVTLLAGEFWVDAGIYEEYRHAADFVERVLSFRSVNTAYGDAPIAPWDIVQGGVRPQSRWSVSSPTLAKTGLRHPARR